MEVTLITHNDLDGTVPVILAKVIWPGLNYYQCSYDDVNQIVDKVLKQNSNKLIHIVDISINEENAKKLNERGNVKLFDHHKTSLWLVNFQWANIDISKSASMIYFDYLSKSFPNSNLKVYYELIKRVNDYDMWIHKYKESMKINTLFELIGHKNFIERFILDPSIILSENEAYILEIEKQKADDYIYKVKNKMKIIYDKSKRYGICFADRYHSELGNRIVKLECLDYIYVIDIFNQKVSIRGNGYTDVSSIAKKHGGGGHHDAAGFILNNKHVDDFISKIVIEEC